MSELAKRLAALEHTESDKCAIGRLLDTLSSEDAEVLTRVMARPDGKRKRDGIPTREIHAHLRNEGIRVGRDTLATHRSKKCSCYAPEAEAAS